ncbi:MAG: hypothetical protein HYZ93_01980 [Candidatus Omnitrophica bacterium]|nr:hypothetical protein [Candidatus Omnitrophota bacterium]
MPTSFSLSAAPAAGLEEGERLSALEFGRRYGERLQVPALDPMQLAARIFRSRLGVPESRQLGALTFTDLEGKARLVLFWA